MGCLEETYIHINEDTFIASNVCIAGAGDIKIGKHCMIASDSGIYANNHNFANALFRCCGYSCTSYQKSNRQGISKIF